MPSGAEPPGAAPRPVPWRGWEAIAVYLISLLISAPITFLGAVTLTKNAGVAFAAATTEIVLLLTVYFWVRSRYGLGLEALGFRTTDVRGDVMAGLGVGLAGLALQFVLLPPVLYIAREVLNREVEPPKQLPLESPSAALLVVIGLTVTILAPIAEELFFRGFLFQAWRKWMGLVAAASWSAVAFAIAHISPLLYLPIGVLGYLLARTFERRDSILASMVGHSLFNVFGFVVIVLTLN